MNSYNIILSENLLKLKNILWYKFKIEYNVPLIQLFMCKYQDLSLETIEWFYNIISIAPSYIRNNLGSYEIKNYGTHTHSTIIAKLKESSSLKNF